MSEHSAVQWIPNNCLMIKLSVTAICLRKGLDQKWDPGHCSTTQIGVWGRPPKSDGLGRRERNQTLACYLIIPLGPQSDFPVEVCLAATPLLSCCLISFSSSAIRTEHLMDAWHYLKLLEV